MYKKLALKCPVCGTEWTRDLNTMISNQMDLVINTQRVFTILCPDDEVEGACGAQLVISISLVPQVNAYYTKYKGTTENG